MDTAPDITGVRSAETPRTGFTGFLSQAESLLKVLSLTGIFLYGIGLLVTNTFLSKYGTSDFSVVKPQCIFTGIWTLTILFLAALPGFAVVIALAYGSGKALSRTIWEALLFIPMCYLASLLALGLFDIYLGAYGVEAPNFGALNIGIPGWRLLLVLMSVFPSLFLLRSRTDRSFRTILPLWIGALIPMCLIASFVVGYEIFETVRREVGGGEPPSATFFFAPEGKDLVTLLRAQTTRTTTTI